jgi:hypothetical protein
VKTELRNSNIWFDDDENGLENKFENERDNLNENEDENETENDSVAIKSVVTSETACFALTTNGEIFVWGVGWNDLIGEDERSVISEPRLCTRLLLHKFVKIVSSSFATFALTDQGQVFACGQDSYSLKGMTSSYLPMFAPLPFPFTNYHLLDIACSENQHYFLATKGIGKLREIEAPAFESLWEMGTGPTGRSQHTSVLTHDNTSILCFGGWQGFTPVGDGIIVIDIASGSWESVPLVNRLLLAGHAAVMVDQQMWVMGGFDGGHNPPFQIFSLDLGVDKSQWKWQFVPTTQLDSMPSPRDSFSAVIVGNNLFVFGGSTSQGFSNSVHLLDTQTRRWRRVSVDGKPPSERQGQVAVYLKGDSNCKGVKPQSVGSILFHGGDVTEEEGRHLLYFLQIEETQEDSNLKLTWETLTTTGHPPATRCFHSACLWKTSVFRSMSFQHREYDLQKPRIETKEHELEKEYLVVFGGSDAAGRSVGVYLLDLESLVWAPVSVNSMNVAPRSAHSAHLIGDLLYILFGWAGSKYTCWDDVLKLDLAKLFYNEQFNCWYFLNRDGKATI